MQRHPEWQQLGWLPLQSVPTLYCRDWSAFTIQLVRWWFVEINTTSVYNQTQHGSQYIPLKFTPMQFTIGGSIIASCVKLVALSVFNADTLFFTHWHQISTNSPFKINICATTNMTMTTMHAMGVTLLIIDRLIARIIVLWWPWPFKGWSTHRHRYRQTQNMAWTTNQNANETEEKRESDLLK